MKKLLPLSLLTIILSGVMALEAKSHHEIIISDMDKPAEYLSYNHIPYFADQEEIGEWSEFKINALVEAGVLVGYPDGTFRPNQTLTRQEFAVALFNVMDIMDKYVYQALENNDKILYEQILKNQQEILKLANELDTHTTEELLSNKSNWIGISASFTPDRDGDTYDTAIELTGKIEVVKLSNNLSVSIRPFVNSATEIGGSVSLDYDITKDLEIWAGIGAAKRLDEDSLGSLTGFSDDVIPYGEVGASYYFSKAAGVYLNVRSPFDSKEGKELTTSAGIMIRF